MKHLPKIQFGSLGRWAKPGWHPAAKRPFGWSTCNCLPPMSGSVWSTRISVESPRGVGGARGGRWGGEGCRGKGSTKAPRAHGEPAGSAWVHAERMGRTGEGRRGGYLPANAFVSEPSWNDLIIFNYQHFTGVTYRRGRGWLRSDSHLLYRFTEKSAKKLFFLSRRYSTKDVLEHLWHKFRMFF